METLDGVNAELARIFAAKERRRHELARLPYPAKVRMVIQLQRMAASILRTRGKMVRPWGPSPSGEKDPSV